MHFSTFTHFACAITPVWLPEHEVDRCWANSQTWIWKASGDLLSLTKLCVTISVGTTRHLLPMTTPAGGKHHHRMSSSAPGILDVIQFQCNMETVWITQPVCNMFEAKHHLKRWVKHRRRALRGGTCLSCAVARSCRSSFCTTVVACEATPWSENFFLKISFQPNIIPRVLIFLIKQTDGVWTSVMSTGIFFFLFNLQDRTE